MAQNLYEDLRDLLQDFKDFLDPKLAVLKPAVQALAALIPQLNDLIDALIGVLQDVKSTIENLDVGAIEHLEDVTSFTSHVRGFLDAAKSLLPDQTDEIDTALRTLDVVGSLPTIDQVKGEITGLVDHLVASLAQLKSG